MQRVQPTARNSARTIRLPIITAVVVETKSIVELSKTAPISKTAHITSKIASISPETAHISSETAAHMATFMFIFWPKILYFLGLRPNFKGGSEIPPFCGPISEQTPLDP